MEKQVGRPIVIDLDDDEDLVINLGEAIPNDPSRPRIQGPDFDKYVERFKFEPEPSQ